jgi:hypothetical protein
MDNEKISDVVKEIASTFHVSEGNTYENKIQERYFDLMLIREIVKAMEG